MLFFLKYNDKNRKQKGRFLGLFNPPDGYVSTLEKRAPFATCRTKGSLTVEASLVLPLFIAALVALIFLIQVMQVQMRVQKALYEESRKLTGYGYFIEKIEIHNYLQNSLEAAYIKSQVIQVLGQEYLNNSRIVDGSKGFHLNLAVNPENGLVDIALQYKMRVPFDLFGIGNVALISRARCHLWCGEQEETKVWDQEMVFMTKNGTVYHLYENCSYLTTSVASTQLQKMGDIRSADGSKYYPCSNCCQKLLEETQLVYYAKYGTRYHSLITCSQLNSNVYLVDRQAVIGKYPMCSKCMERSSKK